MINPGVTEADAIDMLAQHIITKPVFDALFGSYAFAEHNPVSKAMQGMLTELGDQGLETESKDLRGLLRLGASARRGHRQPRWPPAGHRRAVRQVLQDRPAQDRRRTRHRLHPGRGRRLHPPRRRAGHEQAPRPIAQRRGRPHHRPLRRHRHLPRAAAPVRPHQARRPGPQVRHRVARQRDRAARLLHRRRQHRSGLRRTGRETPASTSRSRASCSSTPSSSPRAARPSSTAWRYSKATASARNGRRPSRSWS